jgi:hypothetical protein
VTISRPTWDQVQVIILTFSFAWNNFGDGYATSRKIAPPERAITITSTMPLIKNGVKVTLQHMPETRRFPTKGKLRVKIKLSQVETVCNFAWTHTGPLYFFLQYLVQYSRLLARASTRALSNWLFMTHDCTEVLLRH